MKILELYRTFHIPHATSGNKHCRRGWVQTHCPFCAGARDYHLGFCYSASGPFLNRFVCWRCGGHGTKQTLKKLLNIPSNEVDVIIATYGGKTRGHAEEEIRLIRKRKTVKIPSNIKNLLPHHAKYLRSRKFKPAEIIKKWEIKSTGPISFLSTGKDENKRSIDYSNRIFIPIYWNGIMISFQTRATSKKHPLKYISCPEDREKIPHKTVWYGSPQNKRCVIVEGATDVWRLGDGAMSPFGIKYKKSQVRNLPELKEAFIFFDPEIQAQKQAQKLKADLEFRGIKCWLPSDNDSPLPILKTDPGDLSQQEADKLMEFLGFKKS